jgi:probable rRNA maturation factor
MPIDLLIDRGVDATSVPESTAFARWVDTLASMTGDDRLHRDICIRICNAAQSQALNNRFRGQDKPTNVLSFPAEFDFSMDDAPLGDLAICWDVITREADEQKKSLEAHLAHLTIHGVLHLLGFDHRENEPAIAMENIEIEALAAIGIDNPYESQ